MGGGNCLFSTTIDTTTPIFRGNVSIVEVSSANTNPSKLPDVEPLRAGKIDTSVTRCFDLFCVGKYEQGSDLKLNIRSAGKIPNLVEKAEDGTPVFTKPTYMCTIQSPKGHNVWVKITLEKKTSDLSDYVCLGIKKRGESDYFGTLYADNSFKYVDILETDTVELIPLASSTPLSTGYTPTTVGASAKIIDNVNVYDFGSVYRVHVDTYNGQWLTGLTNNVVISSHWNNIGKIGVGLVTDQNGTTHENQMFSIHQDGTLRYSSDGESWIKNGTVNQPGESTKDWSIGLRYGNGIWCAINSTNTPYGVRRSIDGGRTWSETLANIIASTLCFGNGIFMTVSINGTVYSSHDADVWTQIGKVDTTKSQFLIHGNGKWICSSLDGHIYCSTDGRGTWSLFSDSLYQINQDDKKNVGWCGGCYANKNFYAVRSDGAIVTSVDGEKWIKIFTFPGVNNQNITYYKNKLYSFSATSSRYIVGLLQPDGTIQ